MFLQLEIIYIQDIVSSHFCLQQGGCEFIKTATQDRVCGGFGFGFRNVTVPVRMKLLTWNIKDGRKDKIIKTDVTQIFFDVSKGEKKTYKHIYQIIPQTINFSLAASVVVWSSV